MEMNKKIRKAKNSKKGFTLVELVIVIAILAILSAIAVPIISTVMTSAKLSLMESDCETLDMVVKEARSYAETNNKTVRYGAHNVTAGLATVGDVCDTELLNTHNTKYADFYKRTIGPDTYKMVFVDGTITISGPDTNYGAVVNNIGALTTGNCLEINANTLISDLNIAANL